MSSYLRMGNDEMDVTITSKSLLKLQAGILFMIECGIDSTLLFCQDTKVVHTLRSR